MSSDQRSRHGVRPRAKTVCFHCHARKVKCDLDDRAQGSCTNCWKYQLDCRPRPNRRITVREKYSNRPSSSPASHNSVPHESDVADPLEEANTSQGQETPEPVHAQYLGDMARMIGDTPSLPPGYQRTAAFSESINQQILQISGATSPPPQLLLDACADAYFQHVFHRNPVLDRADIYASKPSMALLQGICMLGTMIRHPAADSLANNEKFYYRAKMLILTEHEKDPLTILKTMCLLMTRTVISPAVLTADSSWYWLGMAIRLLHQSGLHREAVCAGHPRPGTARRIAWCCFIQDKLLSAGLGRPAYIREAEFDVSRLTEEDFETPGSQPLLFIELAKLSCILGQILELRRRPAEEIAIEHVGVLAGLKAWIYNIPTSIGLFDPNGSRRYRRDIYELHIVYFVTVIAYVHLLNDQDVRSAFNLVSLVAASCIARLYEEMDLRDDIHYLLGIHMFFLGLTAMPHLLYNGAEPDSERLCSEELDILVSVLKQLQTKIPGVIVVLNTVNRLRTSHGQDRVGGSRSAPNSGETAFSHDVQDMTLFRDLFPFPSSLSPRLTLLEQAPGTMLFDMSISADATSLNWIFDEFLEFSSGIDWYQPVSLAD